jgi:hypothetical protein
MPLRLTSALALAILAFLPATAAGQSPRPLLPIRFERSAEFRWLNKEVLDRRRLDDGTDPSTWRLEGTGELTFPDRSGPGNTRVLRVDMKMFRDEPAPTRSGLSAVTLRRAFPGEDWSRYNRISLWIRSDVSGFPILPLRIALHNDGETALPDLYHREGIHYVTLDSGGWQQVVWEIEPLPRARVVAGSGGYWGTKRPAAPDDRVAVEVAGLELQRIEPDHYEGWDVAPGRIAFSHMGYALGSVKTALASDLAASTFDLIRVDDTPLGEVVLTRPVETVRTRLGEFQRMDFSDVRRPGRYVIRAGDRHTRSFRIEVDPWRGTMWKVLNFFYGQRCGFHVFDSRGVDHRDWLATHGDQRIVMNGGWHDAGDLSQGLVNTGEATYAMFALAERLQARAEDPELLERLLEEAKWGLDWVLKVRFDGGYRIGFASNNLWTNGIIGDADDRTREALNNPNVNYIAAAAGAIAARVLADRDPDLAARSLRIAEDDWRHAIVGTDGPETWSTPAYRATPLELAGIGALASMELFQTTGERKYAEKAMELARTIVASQQKRFVGPDFPLAGFFHTGPDQDTLFHQYHRGNDQAPVVALAKLVEAFPGHPDWMKWYAAVARYSEYQKTSAGRTAPYAVLPAYVYRDTDHLRMPSHLGRYQATAEAFREQVLAGMPMGDGYHLRAFPVWFARRGHFGVLLSQAKALSAAAHVRRDRAAAELAQKQAQWIVGRNPFTQSTLYGAGYDWAQQYSVSSGDFVGALPVGIQSRGVTDTPYWPPQNMYVYKEVWVHPASRWLWLMQDVAGPALVHGRIEPGVSGDVVLTETASGHSLTIRADREGAFRAFVPGGEYAVQAGDERARVTALPGGTHHLDLRAGRALDLTVDAETSEDGSVTIRVSATGSRTHAIELRTENLSVERPDTTLSLGVGGTRRVEWSGRVIAPDEPWVAVVIPNGAVEARREAVGALARFVR